MSRNDSRERSETEWGGGGGGGGGMVHILMLVAWAKRVEHSDLGCHL